MLIINYITYKRFQDQFASKNSGGIPGNNYMLIIKFLYTILLYKSKFSLNL